MKVKATAEADARMPEAMYCKLEMEMKSGEIHRAEVSYHRGHWKNPMSDAEVEAKFRSLARVVMKPDAADRLLETLWKVETLKDAGEIIRLTVNR